MNQCGKGAKERNTHQVKWERKGTYGCFTNSLERSCFTKANVTVRTTDVGNVSATGYPAAQPG